MKIISKAAALAIQQQHPGSRLFRYCTGKYQWHGRASHYMGQDILDIPGVLAVFVERRQDRCGPYALLRCVTLN